MQIQELGATVSGQLHRAVAFASGDMGILGVLRRDHVEILSRLHALTRSLDAPDRAREQLVHLRDRLRAHCLAEEQALYTPLGQTARRTQVSGQAEQEHRAILRLLAELEQHPVDPTTFRTGLESLQRACALHFQDEEEILFPAARDAFSRRERHTMGTRYRRLRERLLHPDQA